MRGLTFLTGIVFLICGASTFAAAGVVAEKTLSCTVVGAQMICSDPKSGKIVGQYTIESANSKFLPGQSDTPHTDQFILSAEKQVPGQSDTP